MIYFFGYGADRDPSMMEAIIGRVPKGEKATVSGFDLCIQAFPDIPSSARRIIQQSWDHHFKSYVLRPSRHMDSVVTGTMWELTPLERKLVDNWELTGLWYNVFFMTKDIPNKIQMEIQVINNPSITRVVNGRRYKTFINPRHRMLEVANTCRLGYLKNN